MALLNLKVVTEATTVFAAIRSRSSIAVRATIFLSLAAAAAAGVVLLWPRGGTEQAADQVLQITMAGFSQPVITARAGQPLRLRLVNPDSPFHTDGGGWHQFAVPALGLDFRVPPRSQRVVRCAFSTRRIASGASPRSTCSLCSTRGCRLSRRG